jgi:hypothetical protein
LLEWYKLHRAHELELNKATLAYELELAKLLVLLNGAAAGAFLTLIGAVWKDGTRPTVCLVFSAIGAWLAGLLMAAVTTDLAYRAQSKYATAYRFRRQGEELRRIHGTGIKQEHLGIEQTAAGGEQSTSEEKAIEADSARSRARDLWRCSCFTRYAAVCLFIVGGLCALFAFYPSLRMG